MTDNVDVMLKKNTVWRKVSMGGARNKEWLEYLHDGWVFIKLESKLLLFNDRGTN